MTKTLLGRIVGRIDKVKLIRDLVLLAFAGLWIWAAPFYGELFNMSKSAELTAISRAKGLYISGEPFEGELI